MKIFDALCHIGKFGIQNMKGNEVDIFKGREITNGKEMKEWMRKHGVAKAIVVPHYTPNQEKPFREYNPIVLEAIKYDNIFGGLYVSLLLEVEELTRKVLEMKIPEKIKTIKMAPSSFPKRITADPNSWNDSMKENMQLIKEFVIKNDLVLQSHTGGTNSTPENYENFVKEFGDGLRIQFLHMGCSCGGHISFVPRFIQWLKQGYDFYTDTSSVKGLGPLFLVRELEEKHPEGLKRIFFATDNPWGFFPADFALIDKGGFPEDIKKKIFYDNANKVFCKT